MNLFFVFTVIALAGCLLTLHSVKYFDNFISNEAHSIPKQAYHSQTPLTTDTKSKNKPRPSGKRRKNVLLLVAEDLRPQLGCYGTNTITPNLDALAKKSTRFKYAFNQAPICSPSRASLLSGRRPDTTRVYQFESMMGARSSEWLDMAGFFKSNLNYHSYSSGKLYHWNSEQKNGVDETWPGVTKSWNQLTDINYRFMGHNLGGINRTNDGSGGQGFEYTDIKIADQAITYMNKVNDYNERNDKTLEKPFFLAVGFHQPHEPWHFPARYWDIYENITLPVTSGLPPPNMPIMSAGDITPQRGGGGSWSR